MTVGLQACLFFSPSFHYVFSDDEGQANANDAAPINMSQANVPFRYEGQLRAPPRPAFLSKTSHHRNDDIRSAMRDARRLREIVRR